MLSFESTQAIGVGLKANPVLFARGRERCELTEADHFITGMLVMNYREGDRRDDRKDAHDNDDRGNLRDTFHLCFKLRYLRRHECAPELLSR